MRVRLVALIGAAIVVLGALDLARPCDSLLRRISIEAVAFVDTEAADSLWSWVYRQTRERPVAVLGGSAEPPIDLPDRARGSNAWMDVQSGLVTLIPPLDLVLLTKPYWADSLNAFSANVVARNRQLSFAHPPYTQAPHLLYQLGGGVEGLITQALIAEDGRAWVWQVDPDEDAFPHPRDIAVPEPAAREIVALARQAGLGRAQQSDWHCHTLDGRTITLALIDGTDVGRVSYANNTEPTGPGAQLLSLLEATLGLAETDG